MLVVLDTTALSSTYRRQKRKANLTPDEATVEAVLDRVRAVLARLQKGSDSLLVPAIAMQEVLSGVSTDAQYDKILRQLVRFEIGLAEVDDHKEAARLFNACAARGVTPGAPDALIAAMAIRAGGKLLTADGDFRDVAKHTSLELYPLD